MWPPASVTSIPSVVASNAARVIASEYASSRRLQFEVVPRLHQFLLGPRPRSANRAGVLQRGRAKQVFLVRRFHHCSLDGGLSETCSEDAGTDFCKCRVPAGRCVVAEGRKSAVVGGSELVHGNVLRRLDDAVPDLLGCLYVRIDRGNDADEHLLFRLQVFSDDLENPQPVLFSRQGDIEVVCLQLEQHGKQFRVIDVGAVRGVAVTTGAGVNPDPLALLLGEPGERHVVEVDEAA